MNHPSLVLSETTRNDLAGYRRLALIGGAGGSLVLAVLAVVMPSSVMPAYLVGYVYWLGVSIACSLMVMLHYLVGGRWGYPVKRLAEAGALVVIPMALLFIPIVLAAPKVYPWLDAHHIDDVIRRKQAYLNLPFWTGRAIFYFVVWAIAAVVINRWSARLEKSANSAAGWWAKTLSGPGLILVFLAATFASIDWMMSLEPHWFSSIYGPLVIIGWGLTTWALLVIALHWFSRSEPMRSAVAPDRVHEIGNLMFAFMIIWAYLAFMQFLIMWAGNLSEEIPWYMKRLAGGWQLLAIVLMVFHFFLPFFVLLFRDVKRGTATLAIIAAWLLLMRIVDLTWMIVPYAADPARPSLDLVPVLLAPVAVVAIGALWVGLFLFFLPRRPILPANDPGIPATSVAHAGAH